MRILVSNDDGYFSPGIEALVDAVRPFGEVVVYAPERDRSGASNSLTLDRPLIVRRAPNGFHYVDGTPTDCVHLAVTGLLDAPPDLIVSGINDGANMGDDTIYSGTVAAAMEGHLLGVPALAFSMVSRGYEHLDTAQITVRRIVERLLKSPLREPLLLNVNIPNVPPDALGPTVVTRLGRRHAAEPVLPAKNPRGHTMYWIGAAGAERDAGEGTDFHAVRQGCVSVTPLRADLTATAHLSAIGQWLAD